MLTEQTNGRNYTNFKSNLAMMVIISLLSLNSIGQSIFELDNDVDGQTDKQTDGITPILKGA